MTTKTDMTIANTIHAQIGRAAFYMMGAKNILGGGDHLQWKVGRNAKKVTHVTVTLAADDTYTVEFCRVTPLRFCKKTFTSKGGEKKDVVTIPMVYADQLHAVIQEHTGLYLSL